VIELIQKRVKAFNRNIDMIGPQSPDDDQQLQNAREQGRDDRNACVDLTKNYESGRGLRVSRMRTLAWLVNYHFKPEETDDTD
jgi:hypothetical protein